MELLSGGLRGSMCDFNRFDAPNGSQRSFEESSRKDVEVSLTEVAQGLVKQKVVTTGSFDNGGKKKLWNLDHSQPRNLAV